MVRQTAADMAFETRSALGLGVVVARAGTAQAECLSAACSNQITIFMLMVIAFGLLAIALPVMLIRAKWRKAGLRFPALLVAIFAGMPFAMQGWLRLQQSTCNVEKVWVSRLSWQTGRRW